MAEHYRRAEALALQTGQSDLFYPALNLVAAELLARATDRHGPGSSAERLQRVRQSLERKLREDPDFWSVVGLPELSVYEALASHTLAQHLPDHAGQLRRPAPARRHPLDVGLGGRPARLRGGAPARHVTSADRPAANELLDVLQPLRRPMNRIFISYRSSDGKKDADRLCADLSRLYGADQVFFDKQDLRGGHSWRSAIMAALGTRPVVLLLVTPELLGMVHPEGGRRIDRDDDPIRGEVLTAQAHGATIVPLLTEGMFDAGHRRHSGATAFSEGSRTRSSCAPKTGPTTSTRSWPTWPHTASSRWCRATPSARKSAAGCSACSAASCGSAASSSGSS